MNFIKGAPAAAHKAHTVGVRPEHFVVSDKNGEISGTVEYTEVLGSDSFLYINTPARFSSPCARMAAPPSSRADNAYVTPLGPHTHRFGGRRQAARLRRSSASCMT